MVVASTPWVRTSAAAIEATSQMVLGKIALVNPVYLLLNKNKCFITFQISMSVKDRLVNITATIPMEVLLAPVQLGSYLTQMV